MRDLRTILLLGAAAAVAACTSPGTWQNPDVPEEQWGEDRSDCRRIAQRQAAQEYALDQNANRSLDYARGGQWAAQMNTYSTGERQDRLFASCMIQRGYSLKPVEPAGDSGTSPPPATPASR